MVWMPEGSGKEGRKGTLLGVLAALPRENSYAFLVMSKNQSFDGSVAENSISSC